MRNRYTGYWYLALFISFLLGNHNGYVALWTSPGDTPDYIFPYSVLSLPREDQQKLEKGIEIRTKEELMALLEDYLS